MTQDVIHCWAAADPNDGTIKLFADKPRMIGASWVGVYLFNYRPSSESDLLADFHYEESPKRVKMILMEDDENEQ
jgi:hypothetical protein